MKNLLISVWFLASSLSLCGIAFASGIQQSSKMHRKNSLVHPTHISPGHSHSLLKEKSTNVGCATGSRPVKPRNINIDRYGDLTRGVTLAAAKMRTTAQLGHHLQSSSKPVSRRRKSKSVSSFFRLVNKSAGKSLRYAIRLVRKHLRDMDRRERAMRARETALDAREANMKNRAPG